MTAKSFELVAKLDSGAVPGVDGAAFRLFTFGGLYSTTSFPSLAQQWQAIDREGVMLCGRQGCAVQHDDAGAAA